MVSDELRTRLITAAIIGVLFVILLMLGAQIWVFVVLLLSMGCALEWQVLATALSKRTSMIGYLYGAVGLGSAIWLRSEPEGLQYIIFVVACMVATDSMAYIGGKRYGRRKLAPAISPGKTIEGLMCGVVASGVIAVMLTPLAGYPYDAFGAVTIGAILAIGGQCGDLLESWAKRRAGVKDSGVILPGHGGLLDRMDGYFMAFPLFALFVLLYGA